MDLIESVAKDIYEADNASDWISASEYDHDYYAVLAQIAVQHVAENLSILGMTQAGEYLYLVLEHYEEMHSDD